MNSKGGVDPRYFQILVLGILLSIGFFAWNLNWLNVSAIILTGIATQWSWQRWYARVPVDLKSALITTFSLNLLLRSNHLVVLIGLTAAAISSKFIFRWGGKHLFNPANFALGIGLTAFPQLMWISPGQWGQTIGLAVALSIFGSFVAGRAWRLDVSLAFLATFAGLVVLRSHNLGDPAAVPLHKLSSGALVLFSFFMISDPRSTPNARPARILFGVLVAIGAYFIQFKLFRHHGPILSLFFSTPLVPLLDLAFRGRVLQWRDLFTPKGSAHASTA